MIIAVNLQLAEFAFGTKFEISLLDSLNLKHNH
jgi:hypothetical protein